MKFSPRIKKKLKKNIFSFSFFKFGFGNKQKKSNNNKTFLRKKSSVSFSLFQKNKFFSSEENKTQKNRGEGKIKFLCSLKEKSSKKIRFFFSFFFFRV
jgi:hypothetical protein